MSGPTSSTIFSRKLPGESRGTAATSAARNASNPPSAFLSLRLTDQTKIIDTFDLFLVSRGNVQGIFFWSIQVNPVVTQNPTWVPVPNSIFESRTHGTTDFIVTDGVEVAVAPSIARKNIKHQLQYRLTGADELVLIIEPVTSNLTYYTSINWRE